MPPGKGTGTSVSAVLPAADRRSARQNNTRAPLGLPRYSGRQGQAIASGVVPDERIGDRAAQIFLHTQRDATNAASPLQVPASVLPSTRRDAIAVITPRPAWVYLPSHGWLQFASLPATAAAALASTALSCCCYCCCPSIIMDASATLLYAALLLAAAVFLYLRRGSNSDNDNLPPGPTGFPLVGSLPSLDPQLHVYFARLASRYGPIFSIRLGSKLGIVVSSPSLAREVLRDQDLAFSSRDVPDAARSISYGGGQNIVWNPVGPTWRLLRRVCVRVMLSPAGLDNVRGLRAREFAATLRHLRAQADAGNPVDVGAQMFLTVMNVITGTLWGGNIGSEAERAAVGAEFRHLVADITEMLGAPNVSDFFPALARFDLQGIRRKSDVLKDRFDQMFARIIEQRVKAEQAGGEPPAPDFLEYMLKLEKEGGDGKATFTMTNVKALLMDMVVGGTETTSNTVEWAMAELMQKPHLLAKVRDELDAVVGREVVVDETHLPQLPYLHAVVKETLRIHPALPLMVPHCPDADGTVAGYRVPAGSRVFVNVWAIMRDPAVWKDPAEFVPERFLSGGDEAGRKLDFTGSEMDYLPFGSGRRICAGIAMADRMTSYSLAMLLQAFDWELPAGARLDLEERFGIVMKKTTPLVAVPTPRLSRPELYAA
ncbi:Geraniol 8-hydroxylase [Dichanthelium oligosanthes]|uniref:Geraniol 8-hydroxylase n=1 Tax=Dichanthelium oligosanthes TaxID=888268 RepID=A0A1E5VKY7_9POAL|nr:Geraniol 8-hydroxylase [Dichanthelium oligosanthes]